MAAQDRLSATSALPDHLFSNSMRTDLSLDELRFLRSCSRRWFELRPAEASAIIQAARKLVVDLVHEGAARVSDPS